MPAAGIEQASMGVRNTDRVKAVRELRNFASAYQVAKVTDNASRERVAAMADASAAALGFSPADASKVNVETKDSKHNNTYFQYIVGHLLHNIASETRDSTYFYTYFQHIVGHLSPDLKSTRFVNRGLKPQLHIIPTLCWSFESLSPIRVGTL